MSSITRTYLTSTEINEPIVIPNPNNHPPPSAQSSIKDLFLSKILPLYQSSCKTIQEAEAHLTPCMNGTYCIWIKERENLPIFSIKTISSDCSIQVYHYPFTYQADEGHFICHKSNKSFESIEKFMEAMPVISVIPYASYAFLKSKDAIIYSPQSTKDILKKELANKIQTSRYPLDGLYTLTASDQSGSMCLLWVKNNSVQETHLITSHYPGKFVLQKTIYEWEELTKVLSLTTSLLKILRAEQVLNHQAVHLPLSSSGLITKFFEQKKQSIHPGNELNHYVQMGWLKNASFEKNKSPIPEWVKQEFLALYTAHKNFPASCSISQKHNERSQELSAWQYLLSSTCNPTITPRTVYYFPFDFNLTCKDTGFYFEGSNLEKEGVTFCATVEPSRFTLPNLWKAMITINTSSIFSLTNPTTESLGFVYFSPDLYPLSLDNGWCVELVKTEVIYESIESNIEKRLFRCTQEKTPHAIQEISHYFYTNWPDCTPPHDHVFDALLECADIERNNHPDSPITIHCKAGIGRTGTFAITHYWRQKILKEIERLKQMPREHQHHAVKSIVLDFAQVTTDFRIQRQGLILTVEQYYAMMRSTFRYIQKSWLRQFFPDS